MVEPVIIPTHDRTKTDSLLFPGEIRFGPPYFSPGIDKYRFHGRVYGDSCLVPPDARYFAIQGWEAVLEGRGLQTYLLIIDVEANRERQLQADILKEYFAPHATGKYEIEFLTLYGRENLQ